MIKYIQHTWPNPLDEVSPNSVDLIISDPPQNHGVDYSGDLTNDNINNYELFVKRTLNRFNSLLKADGWLAWVCSPEHGKLVWTNLLQRGFNIYNNYPIIWSNNSQKYRYIFVVYKSIDPSTSKYYEIKEKLDEIESGMVWTTNTYCFYILHKNIYQQLINCCGGKVIMDAFAGTGTCGLFDTDYRQIILVEQSEGYLQKIRKRLSND